ncbi:MAG: radical SAM family heme chaperone HemW [Halanaerobiaceae bacterium]
MMINNAIFRERVSQFNGLPGLYIHIPFCRQKCNYCDFYSRPYSDKKKDRFLAALTEEIILYGELLSTEELKTIYFGGGTPSLLSPADIKDLLDLISDEFPVNFPSEITLEANPVCLFPERIQNYSQAGVTRLSLGIQSFSDQDLNLLGRLHSADEAEQTIMEVRKYFNNFNLDFIFAIPNQTRDVWKNNLAKALSYNPPHLSLYNLELPTGTLLNELLENDELHPVEEELDAEMFNMARKILTENGYEHYEISSFCRPGYRSEHNQIYWRYKPYLGLGPGGHGFIGGVRYENRSDLEMYSENLAKRDFPISRYSILSEKDQMAEMIFLGLRLLAGVKFREFKQQFGCELRKVYRKEISRLQEQGLLEIRQKKICLTERGLLLANRVFMEFV